MADYKIDNGIPSLAKPINSKYPFDQMNVEDSFKAPLDDRNTVASAAYQFAKRQKSEWKFKIQKVSETEVRVWRVK